MLPSVVAIVVVLVAILLLVGMFLVIYRWWKRRDDTGKQPLIVFGLFVCTCVRLRIAASFQAPCMRTWH